MPYPPLSPSAVAEIVCRYRRGESTPQIARILRLPNSTIVRALDWAGVWRRGQSEAQRLRHVEPAGERCRCCGIILAEAGCGNEDGVCDVCWADAEKLASRWGITREEALERWIRDSAMDRARELDDKADAELGEWCVRILERRDDGNRVSDGCARRQRR